MKYYIRRKEKTNLLEWSTDGKKYQSTPIQIMYDEQMELDFMGLVESDKLRAIRVAFPDGTVQYASRTQMSTIQEWAQMSFVCNDDKRFVYKNDAASKISVMLETDLSQTDAYLEVIFTYPANDVKFEMVSCALRNDGNVSYVLKEEGTEQLVLVQSGDFRIENEQEAIIVDGSEIVRQTAADDDDTWNQIILGLEKLSKTIDTKFNMKETGGKYVFSWSDITEDSWDGVSKLDSEKMIDLNQYISNVQLMILNTSVGFYEHTYAWNRIDVAQTAVKVKDGYTCTFNSYGELFEKFDSVPKANDVYLIKLVYTLMNGKELYDKNIIRYCLNGNLLPDANKWNGSVQPALNGEVKARELTITASCGSYLKAKETAMQVIPEFTAMFGTFPHTRQLKEMDYANNSIIYTLSVKELDLAEEGGINCFLELRDASDKKYDPDDIYPETDKTVKTISLGSGFTLQYPDVKVELVGEQEQLNTETFEFVLEITVPSAKDEQDLMKYIDDIDYISLCTNDGYFESEQKEITSFRLNDQTTQFQGVEGKTARYKVVLNGNEIPNSVEDSFGFGSITKYQLRATIGSWKRDGSQHQIRYTYQQPEYDPLQYEVWDFVEAVDGKAQMRTSAVVKWHVKNATEDNGVLSHLIRVHRDGERDIERVVEGEGVQLTNVSTQPYTITVESHRQMDWKYMRTGSITEVFTPYADFITEHGYHPALAFDVQNLIQQFNEDSLSPLLLAWDYFSKSQVKAIKGNDKLYEIVYQQVINPKSGFREIQKSRNEIRQTEVRTTTLAQQDFAYQVLPVVGAESGKVRFSDGCYYEVYANYDTAYPEYMKRLWGDEAIVIDGVYESRINSTVFRKREFQFGDKGKPFYRYDSVYLNIDELDDHEQKVYMAKPLAPSIEVKKYYQGQNQMIKKVITREDGTNIIDYVFDTSLFADLAAEDNYVAAAICPGSLVSTIYKFEWRFAHYPKNSRVFLFHNLMGSTFMNELKDNQIKSGEYKIAIPKTRKEALFNSGKDPVAMFVVVEENGKCTFVGWNFNILLDNGGN